MASQKIIEKLAGQFVLKYLGRDIEYLDIAEMRETEEFSDEDLRDLYSRASAILDNIRYDYEIEIKLAEAEARMDAARVDLRVTHGMNLPAIVEFFAAQETLFAIRRSKR